MKPAILGHTEFAAFQQKATKGFADWRKATTPRLTGFDKGGHPKALIETIAEASPGRVPPVTAARCLRHLPAPDGLLGRDHAGRRLPDRRRRLGARGAQPREIVQVKDKNKKLVWPEPHDYMRGKRRFKSDLVPAPILVARYFVAERDAIEELDNQLATLEQQLDEMRQENSGEDGLLAEVIEGEGDKQKIAAKAVKARLKEIGKDPLYADERAALEAYAGLLKQQTEAKAKRKAAQEDLDKKIDAKYPTLTEAEIKTLVVDDKWMTRRLSAAVQGELDRVSQTLTGRIRRVGRTLRHAAATGRTDDVATLASRVDEHLQEAWGRPGREASGYKQTQIGVIPQEWDVDCIEDVALVATGHDPPPRFRRRVGGAASIGDHVSNFSGGYSASCSQLSTEWSHVATLHYGDIHGATMACIDARADYQDIDRGLNILWKRSFARVSAQRW